MKMYDRIIEALFFIMFSAFSGYGFFSFFQMMDIWLFMPTPVLNTIFAVFFGISSLAILILLRRATQ